MLTSDGVTTSIMASDFFTAHVIPRDTGSHQCSRSEIEIEFLTLPTTPNANFRAATPRLAAQGKEGPGYEETRRPPTAALAMLSFACAGASISALSSRRGNALASPQAFPNCARRPRMTSSTPQTGNGSVPGMPSPGGSKADAEGGVEDSRARFGPGVKKYSGDPMAGPSVLPHPPPESYDDTGTAIMWFRNDLRLLDNAALELASTAKHMVPIYVFDERHYSMDYPSEHGFQRTGQYRAFFALESVRLLKRALKFKMSDLVVKVGFTEDAIAELAETLVEAGYGPVRVVAHKETTRDETDMEEAVADAVAQVGLASGDESASTAPEIDFIWGSTLLLPDDMKFNPTGPALPPTFTQFRKKVEAEPAVTVRPEIQPPDAFKLFPLELRLKSDEWPSLRHDLKVEGIMEPHDYPFPHIQACFPFEGGEKAGLERLDDWIFKRGCLSTYFDTRNESGVSDSSSKFSPWLALGCLSPRSVYWACKRYEEQTEANKSTYHMVFELLTRDYFRWVAAQVGDRLFALNGFSGEAASEKPIWKLATGAIDAEATTRLEAWMAGETGAPFVDAPMRELAATGFMSNRGRQNAASFFIHDLEYPDWRAGAEYFESQLIDHDVAANWGNWAYIAGVGSDSRGGRHFNVVKQSMEYDPMGWYIKRWCSELRDIPSPLVHQPHTLTEEDCEALEFDPDSYPQPVVPLLAPPDSSVDKLQDTSNGSMFETHRPSAADLEPGSEEDTKFKERAKELLEELTVYPGAADEEREDNGPVLEGVQALQALAERISKGLE